MLRRTLLSSLLQTALLGAGAALASLRVRPPPDTMLGLRPLKRMRPIW